MRAASALGPAAEQGGARAQRNVAIVCLLKALWRRNYNSITPACTMSRDAPETRRAPPPPVGKIPLVSAGRLRYTTYLLHRRLRRSACKQRRGVRAGRRSTIGNRVCAKSVSGVRIPASPPLNLRSHSLPMFHVKHFPEEAAMWNITEAGRANDDSARRIGRTPQAEGWQSG